MVGSRSLVWRTIVFAPLAIALCFAVSGRAMPRLQYGPNALLGARTKSDSENLIDAPYNIYVAQASRVYGYSVQANGHAEEVCTKDVSQYSTVENIAVDRKGNLLVPLDANGNTVSIYTGPQMCGRLLGEVGSSADGYAVDAASLNVSTGKIVVALAPPFSLTGGVEVCRLGQTCSRLHITGQYILGAMAVAIDGVGDCWAVVELFSGRIVLDYFKHCAQNGVAATGWVNPSGGGLDVDTLGNLVSIAPGKHSALYVYQGCRPSCTLIGGPFHLAHEASYGHISHDGALFASTGRGRVDVYAYHPNGLAHLFSFETGLSYAVGVAFSPGH